jgi:hypothetical protein
MSREEELTHVWDFGTDPSFSPCFLLALGFAPNELKHGGTNSKRPVDGVRCASAGWGLNRPFARWLCSCLALVTWGKCQLLGKFWRARGRYGVSFWKGGRSRRPEDFWNLL